MQIRNAPPITPDDKLYANCVAEIEIKMNAEDFFDWFKAEPVENYMHGTLIVPSITGDEVFEGPAWWEANSVRKLMFSDGTSCLERIEEADFPRSYTYQPWAYDNPVRFISDHALGKMIVEQRGDVALLRWEYGFHARSALALPLLKLFMAGNWKPHLQAALERMRDHLEAHGPKMKMHEVVLQQDAA